MTKEKYLRLLNRLLASDVPTHKVPCLEKPLLRAQIAKLTASIEADRKADVERVSGNCTHCGHYDGTEVDCPRCGTARCGDYEFDAAS